eukprot:sb/3465003/
MVERDKLNDTCKCGNETVPSDLRLRCNNCSRYQHFICASPDFKNIPSTKARTVISALEANWWCVKCQLINELDSGNETFINLVATKISPNLQSRFDSLKEDIDNQVREAMDTANQKIESQVTTALQAFFDKQQNKQPSPPNYAQLALTAADFPPLAPNSATPPSKRTPTTVTKSAIPWKKIVIDCDAADIDEVEKLSQAALLKTKVSKIDKKKNSVVITVPDTEGQKAADSLTAGLTTKSVRVRATPTSKVTILNFPLFETISAATTRESRNAAILELLREKNPELNDRDVDVVYFRPNARITDVCTVGIRLPTPIKRQLLNQGVVYVDFVACRVVDRVHVIQCYNCQSFHHTSDICTKEPICVHCAGSHKSDCCSVKSSENFVPSCINCSLASGSSESHKANSLDCPIYKSKFDVAKSKNE